MWNAASPDTDKVVPAFVKALASMPEPHKEKSVKAGPMQYRYADLATVIATVKPVLAAENLAFSQTLSDAGVATMIMHDSGQWLAYPAFRVVGNPADAQKHGSALTYSKRYALLSIMGIATEDDDGKAASAPAPAPSPMVARIDGLIDRMRQLPDDEKEALKDWASQEDKSLAPKALAEDTDWLAEVESYLQALVTTEES